MSTISNNELLKVTQEDLRSVREQYGLNDDQKLNDSIEAVKEWYKKQNHFVAKELCDKVIENILLLSSGSIEGAKQKLDHMFSSRGIMGELTLNRSAEEFDKFLDIVDYVPLPKMTPKDHNRVFITRFLTDNYDNFSMLLYFRYAFLIGDCRIFEDCSFMERYVLDLANVRLPLIGKLNPLLIKKAEILCMEGYGTKIKGIHILNAPSFVDKIVFLLKQALKAKVANRIFVHNSYEDFHKHVPKSILPVEYGGEEQSMTKLSAQWKDELRSPEVKERLRTLDTFITDESLRSNGKVSDDFLGMQGSFRMLNVD